MTYHFEQRWVIGKGMLYICNIYSSMRFGFILLHFKSSLQAARILVVLLCKHEFDARYQKPEDKLYIAQLYFPLIGQVNGVIQVFVSHSISYVNSIDW